MAAQAGEASATTAPGRKGSVGKGDDAGHGNLGIPFVSRNICELSFPVLLSQEKYFSQFNEDKD